MLYTPFAAGLGVSRRISWAVLLLLVAVTCLFVGREALVVWWRARSRGEPAGPARRQVILLFGIGIASGVVPMLAWRLLGLLWLGLAALVLLGVHFSQVVRREHRAVAAELLGIVGLTLTAPAAYYAARGRWDATALWLWALCALYFASSVFYVKLQVLALQPRKEQVRRSLQARSGAYHALVLLVIASFAATSRLHALAAVAYLPILARTAWSLLRPAQAMNLRRIGALEIVYAVNFLIFITLAFARG